MNSVVCAVCNDTGLLSDEWCPLCEGFGREDWLDMQHSRCASHKGRLLVRRLTRGCSDFVSADEKDCIEEFLLSKAQRKKKKTPQSSTIEGSGHAS